MLGFIYRFPRTSYNRISKTTHAFGSMAARGSSSKRIRPMLDTGARCTYVKKKKKKLYLNNLIQVKYTYQYVYMCYTYIFTYIHICIHTSTFVWMYAYMYM